MKGAAAGAGAFRLAEPPRCESWDTWNLHGAVRQTGRREDDPASLPRPAPGLAGQIVLSQPRISERGQPAERCLRGDRRALVDEGADGRGAVRDGGAVFPQADELGLPPGEA